MKSDGHAWTSHYCDRRACLAILPILAILASCSSMNSRLNIAVMNNDLDQVRLVLDKGATPDSSLIRHALADRESNLIRLLLDKGAIVNRSDIGHVFSRKALTMDRLNVLLAGGVDSTYFHQTGVVRKVLSASDYEIVGFFFDRKWVTQSDANATIPTLGMWNLLMAQGFDMSTAHQSILRKHGWKPLHKHGIYTVGLGRRASIDLAREIQSKSHSDYIRYAIDEGRGDPKREYYYDLDVRSFNVVEEGPGYIQRRTGNYVHKISGSLLFLAAKEGQLETLKVLVEAGLDVNELDSDGRSLLALLERNLAWPRSREIRAYLRSVVLEATESE